MILITVDETKKVDHGTIQEAVTFIGWFLKDTKIRIVLLCRTCFDVFPVHRYQLNDLRTELNARTLTDCAVFGVRIRVRGARLDHQ